MGNYPGAIFLEDNCPVTPIYVCFRLVENQMFCISCLAFLRFTLYRCTVAIKSIRNMHAVSTNQIEDILHFNYKNIKIMGFRNFQLRNLELWSFDVTFRDSNSGILIKKKILRLVTRDLYFNFNFWVINSRFLSRNSRVSNSRFLSWF